MKEEPTVLDYVKSLFKDKNTPGKFAQALFKPGDSTPLDATRAAENLSGEVEVPAPGPELPPVQPEKVRVRFPWEALLSLAVALFAQRMFEPPNQNAPFGIALYVFAMLLAGLAILRGGLTPTPLPASESRADPLTIRGLIFVLSLIMGGLTFYYMMDNTFNASNLAIWAITVLLHLRAFWLSEPRKQKQGSAIRRMADFFTRREWTIRITRWGLLVIAVSGLVLFFRTYRLYDVPLEMTSDHAEKLMDVYDILQGQYSIFFPRNTGREPMYIYLSALIADRFTGISFLTLKIAAVIGGLLTLPYIYLIGRELGGKRIGMLAVIFAGFAYWPSVIERFGLRISFYPLFAAVTLYYLLRGLRRQSRNDFILAGVGLGLGLNGYTPFRIMPFIVVAIVVIYLLHVRDKQTVKQTLIWLVLLALTSWIFFIPLARVGLEMPDAFGFRALSRLSSVERPLPGPAWQIFLSNLWVAAREMNWYDGNIWVHSIPGRPALDVVSGALYLLGSLILVVRYIRSRHWADIVLLLSVPMLQMPSILSLAFPDENPSLNRTGGAIVPVFLIVAIALDSLLNGMGSRDESAERPAANADSNPQIRAGRPVLAALVTVGLLYFSFTQNYDLVFNQYNHQYLWGAWNSSEMGSVMREFIESGAPADNAWIVPFPFWVDTRLAPMWAGVPGRDMAIAPENLASTAATPGAKLFMFALNDTATMNTLEELYPQGKLTRFKSTIEPHDFFVFRVPATP